MAPRLARNKNTSLLAYTLSHFCVDFGCVFAMFRIFSGGGAEEALAGSAFLAYTVIAFGLQAPIGDFLDRHSRAPAAQCGFALIAAGLVLAGIFSGNSSGFASIAMSTVSVDTDVLVAGPGGAAGTVPDAAGGGAGLALAWAAVCAVALGNALFHSEGGIDSLVNAGGRLSRSGVYVCSGAMGVALGVIAGQGGNAPAGISVVLPIALIGVSAAAVRLFKYQGAEFEAAAPAPYFSTDTGRRPWRGRGPGHTVSAAANSTSATPATANSTTATPAGGSLAAGPALALLFAAVVIRAYGGGLIQAPWRADYVLLPGIAACAGKASGGFLADALGARKTGCIPLLACIPLLCFGYANPALCAAGIFLFNTVMPVTLCAFSDRLRGHPGLAFGTASLALLVGASPQYYARPAQGASLLLLPLLCAAAAAAIFVTVSEKGKKNAPELLPEKK